MRINLELNKRRQEQILFVLRVPPPYGGGEIMNQFLYESLKDKYEFFIVKQDSHSKKTQGRLTFSNLFYGLLLIVQVCAKVVLIRPRILFIGIPKDFPAFVRTSIIINFAHLLGATIVGDLHGMSFPFLSSTAKTKYFRNSINKLSRLRVLSKSIEEYMRTAGYQNAIAVVDNAVEPPAGIDVHRKGYDGGPLKLLYLGSISESKGFQRVLSVLSGLQRAGDNETSLTVVGEWISEAYKEDSLKRIRDLKIDSRISFKGILVGLGKWNAIVESDLLLHLTDWDGQPLTIVEAMVCGVPTIATKVGAIPEMIGSGKNGFLVDNPVDETIGLLLRMQKREIDLRLISENARDVFKQRFTKENFVKQMEEFVCT